MDANASDMVNVVGSATGMANVDADTSGLGYIGLPIPVVHRQQASWDYLDPKEISRSTRTSPLNQLIATVNCYANEWVACHATHGTSCCNHAIPPQQRTSPHIRDAGLPSERVLITKWRECTPPAETADCASSHYSLSSYWLSQHCRRSHYADVCPFPPSTCVRLTGQGSRSSPSLQGSVCIPLAHSRSQWPRIGVHPGVGRATRRHQTGRKKWAELAILPRVRHP